MNQAFSPQFEAIIKVVLDEEGGYSNNPVDPGGETNLGITWPILRRGIADGLIPVGVTIKALTVDQAKLLYNEYFWKPVRGDQLPIVMALYMFDCAVNQGVIPAIRMLQRAINLPQDGVLGVQTMTAVQGLRPWHQQRFMAYRAMRYTSTRNFDRFGEGWLIRLFDVVEKGARL